MFGRIRALIVKEILMVWRDKKSRAVLIFPPLFQLFVFAFAATLDVQNVSIGILNRDFGKPAFELVQRFKGSPTFKRIRYLNSVKEITAVIDLQEVMMVLYIDDQFSRSLYAGNEAAVQLIFDGRKSNTTQIVQGYALNIIDQFSRDFAREQGFHVQPTVLVTRNWYNPNLLYYWFNIPNLFGVLTMVVTVILTALSVAREREMGTFDQLLVSPAETFEILVGKTLPPIMISVCEATVILAIAVFFFRIPFTGSLVLLYCSLLVFVSSIVGVGLFISSLCNTQQQAVLGSYVFMSPAILLSGYATPVENMPLWLQKLNLLNPLSYFLVIVKGIFLKNMPAYLVFQNTWPMALIAVFTLSGADWFFRKRLE